MSRRNERKPIIENNHALYKKKITDRGLNKIIHYGTQALNPVTARDINDLTVIDELWRRGDRMYKYAYKYYGDSSLWWVIAWFNSRPTDSHFRIGEVFMIPMPLEDVLQKFNS